MKGSLAIGLCAEAYKISEEYIEYLRSQKPENPRGAKEFQAHLQFLKLKCIQNKKNAMFVQSDGSRLRYALYGNRGTQYCDGQLNWKLTVNLKSLYKVFTNEEKDKQTKLGLWSAWKDHSNLILIAADFDNLPQGFSSHDNLYLFLKKHFSDNGIVLRTLSTKCKVLFQIEISNIYRSKHTKIARTALKEVLGENLYSACDVGTSALSIFFLSHENVDLVANRLKTLKPVFDEAEYYHSYPDQYPITPAEHTIEDKGVDIVCKEKSAERVRIFSESVDGALSKYMTGDHRETFVRALMCHGRLLHGGEITQNYFRDGLGMSQSTISRYKDELIRDGNLVEIDSSYKVGGKGKTYRALGDLKTHLERTKPSINLEKIPNRIANGNWHKKLFHTAISNFVCDPEGFRNWAYSLEGAQLKDRPRKIEQIYRKLLKKII